MGAGLALPYMGTKRGFAPTVADVICGARPGVVMDAFSGMCAIGQSVGTRRNVWNNDVQLFASQVATALFTSPKGLKLSDHQRQRLKSAFELNLKALTDRFSARLSRERNALSSNRVSKIRKYLEGCRHVGNSKELDKERSQLSLKPQAFPYRLCSITFADGYFGLRQSLEIDSARYAVDKCERDGIIDESEARWLLIALCHAVVRIATTTGHFAQFLKVGANNLRKYVDQRLRPVWTTWESCQADLRPLGNPTWRTRNRAFNRESIALLGYLADEDVKPGVIYADPPYTDDQYSRYYHVWETVLKYDYPKAEGEGRYREDRFYTPFSRVSEVRSAFENLFERSARLDADLVLSYPEDGLLQQVDEDVEGLLRKFFAQVTVAAELSHSHSTMGGSKGVAKRTVLERIYLASNQ